MTAAVFIAAMAAAYIHLQAVGWYVWPGYTIYVVAFAVVLAVAVLWALLSKSWRCFAGAGVLTLNLAATHWGWANGDVLVNQAIIDLATAAYFILAGGTRWEWAIGAVYLVSVGTAGAAYFDVIPGLGERPPVFLAFNYADLTSLCGHFASIILGLGAGDWGKRVRTRARVQAPWAPKGGLAMRMVRR